MVCRSEAARRSRPGHFGPDLGRVGFQEGRLRFPIDLSWNGQALRGGADPAVLLIGRLSRELSCEVRPTIDTLIFEVHAGVAGVPGRSDVLRLGGDPWCGEACLPASKRIFSARRPGCPAQHLLPSGESKRPRQSQTRNDS